MVFEWHHIKIVELVRRFARPLQHHHIHQHFTRPQADIQKGSTEMVMALTAGTSRTNETGNMNQERKKGNSLLGTRTRCSKPAEQHG
jgi:hypothetical protein